MDIKELNKTQLVLLTLLITFVVSIATAIVTVSLMKQMPKDIPQTINNVIERTIEKITTVESPKIVSEEKNITNDKKENISQVYGDGNSLISIYAYGQLNKEMITKEEAEKNKDKIEYQALGQGVILSDIGLILVDSNILTGSEKYNIELNKIVFEVSLLKKFDNGFSILKINPPQIDNPSTTNTENKENIPKID